MESFEYLIIAGRWQTFHNGHYTLVEKALALAEKAVILFICSADKQGSVKNPYSYAVRKQMIQDCFPASIASGKLVIRIMNDYKHDSDWSAAVLCDVDDYLYYNKQKGASVAVVSSTKGDDHLLRKQWFPELQVKEIDVEYSINATDLRTLWFSKQFDRVLGQVPDPVLNILHKETFSQHYISLQEQLWNKI